MISLSLFFTKMRGEGNDFISGNHTLERQEPCWLIRHKNGGVHPFFAMLRYTNEGEAVLYKYPINCFSMGFVIVI